MSERMASRLKGYFRERAGDDLRSIVRYEPDTAEVVYLREGIRTQYTDREVERAIDSSRMESLAAPVYEGMFTESHGELTCLVQCFENAVEMNFVLTDGVGTTVALDAGAMQQSHDLLADARGILTEERP